MKLSSLQIQSVRRILSFIFLRRSNGPNESPRLADFIYQPTVGEASCGFRKSATNAVLDFRFGLRVKVAQLLNGPSVFCFEVLYSTGGMLRRRLEGCEDGGCEELRKVKLLEFRPGGKAFQNV
jgi:hypothetical protein